MKLKLTLLIISLAQLAVAALRRNPRVYNALITTDQNLRSSRTYPVIQPHIEYPTIPYGSPLDPTWLSPYNPYYAAAGSYPGAVGHHPYYADYQPYGLAPQIGFDGRPLDDDHHADGYRPQSAGAKGSDDAQEQNGESKNDKGDSNKNNNQMDTSSRGDQQSNDEQQSSSSSEESDANKNQQSQSPLPLNEYGLPPNLVPINPLQNAWNLQRHDPINLSPYPYHSYPLIYDHIPSYQPSPFLPPYGLFSPELVAGRRPSQRQPSSGQGKRDKQQPKNNSKKDQQDNKKDDNADNQNDDQQKQNEQKNKQQQDEQNNDDQKKQEQMKNEQEQQDQSKDDSSQQEQKQQQQKRRQAKQDRLIAPIVVGNSAMPANIKNFDPINRNVPDVPPPPPPSGSKDTVA